MRPTGSGLWWKILRPSTAAAAALVVLGHWGPARAQTPTGSGGTRRLPAAREVRVEVLPGIPGKIVDTALSERIPAAVLGAPDLDVRDLDPASLVLSGAAVTKSGDGELAAYRDVDGDGRGDLIVQFDSSRIRLGERGTRVLLSGRLRDGGAIRGSATLRTVDGVRSEHRHALRLDPASEKLPPIPVGIDVLPGDPSNRIDLGNRGTVEVAILSGPTLDATTLDPATISLAGSPATRRAGAWMSGRGGGGTSERADDGMSERADVDGDGRDDLIIEVPKRFLQLKYGSTQAILRALGPGGRPVEGVDQVRIGDKATMTFESGPVATAAQPGPEFVQTAGITINDLAPATPYPSSITVSGVTGVVSKVRVTLKGLSHTYPDDIDILLVGPTGQSLILVSDAIGIAPGVSNVDLTFDDDSAFQFNALGNPTSGTYRPANFGGGDTFPAPAPAPSAATGLSVFEGTDPNGTWSLYVVDDLGGDSGTIAGGWSLDFIIATEVCNPAPIALLDNTAAAPYPSPINVAGLPTAVSKVTVKLKDLTHPYPDDIDMLLVGPGGQKALVMSDVGGTHPGITKETLVLDDNAALTLDPSVNPAPGTYQPLDLIPGDTFPGPAPAGPYLSALAQFNGSDPNGSWSLYAQDDSAADAGSVGGGWCLDITTMTPAVHSNPTFVAIPNGEPAITQGQASFYPSVLNVSGVDGFISKLTLTLDGLSHTYPQDLDILLVGPNGGKEMLMSDVGGGGPGLSGATLTFDDYASPLPVNTNPGSGTWAPTNDDSGGIDTMPAPAPAGPYRTFISDFAFSNPNGSWYLYIYDDAAGDVGTLSGGWTLTIQTYLDASTSHYPFNFCNFDGITIPSGAPSVTQGRSAPYPSDMLLGDFTGLAELDHYKVVVDLYGLTHSFPQDLDILVGQVNSPVVLLMSDAGGIGPGLANVDLTFDDDAAAVLPQSSTPLPGVYRPTDYDDGFPDNFPDPCPPNCGFGTPVAPFSTSLSALKGVGFTAFWTLWIMDDAAGDTGSLSGWCLRFIPTPAPGEVPNLRWTDATTLTWDAGANATSYDIYRGDPSQQPALLDPSLDSCPRATTLTQKVAGLSENPPLGSFYWYLVRGRNGEGEGPGGFARLGAQQTPARIQNASSGACP